MLRVACPDRPTARDIAHAAVTDGLAASANLLEAESIYRWDGAVHDATETVIVFKTTDGKVAALCTLIRLRHPYALPAITWVLVNATPETIDWIAAATAQGTV